MAAALPAATAAVSALTALAGTVLSVYDAVGEHRVGRSDLVFRIADWASLMAYARGPIARALEDERTRARALRVLDLNAAVACWLAGTGFGLDSATARWNRPKEVRRWVRLPRFWLAKKAGRLKEMMEVVKGEVGVLVQEVERIRAEVWASCVSVGTNVLKTV